MDLNKATKILKQLQEYKSNMLDSVQGNSLKKPLSDYHRLLDVFEEDLIDCIELCKRNELTKYGKIQMKWLVFSIETIV